MSQSGGAAAVESLFHEMADRAAEIGGAAWKKNSGPILAYMRDLAEDAVKTQAAILSGKLDEETANEILAMQRRARHSLALYTELTALQSAQAILDMATGLVVNTIRTATGVNLSALIAR
jgi:hypothetical protein